jgi:hypothetical protein
VAISAFHHVAAAEHLSKVVSHGSHAAENVATNRERAYLAQRVATCFAEILRELLDRCAGAFLGMVTFSHKYALHRRRIRAWLTV